MAIECCNGPGPDGNNFSLLFVPEEFLLDDEEDDVVVVECGDINTELGVKESLSDILEIAEG